MAFRVTGLKELLMQLKRIELEAPAACAFGMYEGMQEVMIEAKNQAPKDTWAMANSGYVTPPSVMQGNTAKIEAGFGGASEEYVVRQHEDTSLRHPNGGNAKFFSNALDARMGDVSRLMSEYVNTYLQTGRIRTPPKKVPTTPTEHGPDFGSAAAADHGKHE